MIKIIKLVGVFLNTYRDFLDQMNVFKLFLEIFKKKEINLNFKEKLYIIREMARKEMNKDDNFTGFNQIF